MSESLQALSVQLVGKHEKAGIPVKGIRKLLDKDSHNIIGRHMNTGKKTLDEASEEFDAASKNVGQAAMNLVTQMSALSKQAKESVARSKDMAAQMADAMNRVTKVVGPDFEKRLLQLEQLTDCLERLSALNDAGKLTPLLSALHVDKNA